MRLHFFMRDLLEDFQKVLQVKKNLNYRLEEWRGVRQKAMGRRRAKESCRS